MAYSGRPLSPGSKRLSNPGRISDSRVTDNYTDLYRADRHNSLTSSKNTGGVVPISTETFVNYPPPSNTRSDHQRYDTYSGRPLEPPPASGRSRQISLGEGPRGSANSGTQSTSRTRPTIVQGTYGRPASPQKHMLDRDHYVTPAASKERGKETHRKVYAVNEGSANLVADVNVPKEGERHHRRRQSESGDRGGYIRPPSDRDRAQRGYHLNGPSVSKRPEKSIEDDDAYSYTNAAGMFRDTEPSWREREAPRARRNSIDRSGGSRERPVGMLDPNADSRRTREIGPPPSTRGWDKLNEITRSRSTRERPRDGPQSPTRATGPMSPPSPRIPQSPTRGRYAENGNYADSRDPYYVAPRIATDDRKYLAVNRDRSSDRHGSYDSREARRPERRNSTSRAKDPSVERRGFGIRADSRDRYGRGSDENTSNRDYYRDAGPAFAGPQRRETAPILSQQDEPRLEQERRDRIVERETREPRRREDGYSRDYERRDRDYEPDVDREREKQRERMFEPQPETERHHHRVGSYRDREYDRKEYSSRDDEQPVVQPGLSSAAVGGVAAAGAAGVYGLSKYNNRDEERDRDRDRERERDRDENQRLDRPPEHDRDRLSPRSQEPRPVQDFRPTETRSDEDVPYQTEQERYRSDDHERGLGFAFEDPPEPPRSAPPPTRERSDTVTSRDTTSDRDFERSHEDQPPLDPDEDYRRRKEQVQRELGRAPDERSSDSDPDRERRRREREERLRHREPRNGQPSSFESDNTYTDTAASYQVPGSFEDEIVVGAESTASRGLRRKPSILDEPMTTEPVQIIDNSLSERRENRVRIVDPPTEEEDKRPKGILKRPKEKFPDYPDAVREGVAPLKDATKSGIPPGARWTKIDRRLVNPEALEEAKERFEERLDCVIVLRVLTKEDIQKLADRTKALRDKRYQEERDEKKAARRRDRDRDRHERDEYDDDSENEFKPKPPKMLEAPAASAGASTVTQSDYSRDDSDRRRDRDEREPAYASSRHGRRDEYSDR